MDIVTAILTGGATAATSFTILRFSKRIFEQQWEKEQEGKKTPLPPNWSTHNMNRLYQCYHEECGKYHRAYQQELAQLQLWVDKETDLNHLFSSALLKPICPHCLQTKYLTRSDAAWEFLDSHPHCLKLDEQGAERIYALMQELKKTIKANEEIAAYQAYNGFVQQDIAGINLEKKDDRIRLASINADKITVGVYRDYFDIDGNYNIPRELEVKTMPDPDEEDLLNHVRQVHEAMRKIGIDIDDYGEKPKGYDTSRIRGMFHSLDEENAHRAALGKEPRFPEPVEPKRDFDQIRAEFEECQAEVNAFHDVNRFKVNYTKEEIAFHQAEYKELYARFEALREEMWNYQGKPKSMTELTEEIRRLEEKVKVNQWRMKLPDTPQWVMKQLAEKNKELYKKMDILRNERMTAR